MKGLNNEAYTPTPDTDQVKENVAAGIAGAFLFSLAGGIVYFALYLIGITASISGFVGVICAIKGYSIFAKRESKRGVLIAVVASLLVIVLAWYFCLSFDVYTAYQEWYAAGEVEYALTFSESIACAHLFLEEPEIATSYFGNLALGLIFCALGGGGYVYTKLKKMKSTPEAQDNGENE